MLAACGLTPERLHHAKSENSDIEIYGATAGIRSIFLRKSSSESTYCAEPAPDVAIGGSESGNIGASQSGAGSEKVGISESTQDDNLGGRSVNVLITREIFYRTCEFLSNVNLSKEEKVALFNTSLQHIVNINSVNLGKGTVPKENPIQTSNTADQSVVDSTIKDDQPDN